MSSYRQQVQFLIQPKFFKCLNFGYKSDYNISFRLIHESQKGKKVVGFPFIIKSPIMTSRAFRDEKKEPKGDKQTYETQQFSVMFDDEDFQLNEMCIFKIEYKAKKLAKGKTYLQVSLLSHKNLFLRSDINSNQTKLERVSREIETRIIYLNRQEQELNQFYQVDFTENDYFGHIVFYICSSHLGWKIRRNPSCLGQFASMPTPQRLKLTDGQQEKTQSFRSSGLLIKNTVKDYLPEIEDFYNHTLKRQQKEHCRLFTLYENFRNKMQVEETLDVIYAPKQIDEIVFQHHQNLSQFYETKDLHEIYFHLYKESTQIATYNRWIWQQFCQLMLLLPKHLAQQLATEQIQSNELQFFNLTTNVLTHKTQWNQKQKKQFKQARKAHLQGLAIYDEWDKSHPFITFYRKMKKQTSRTPMKESLVIFVHGYKGNSSDLMKAANYLMKYNPNCDTLMIRTLENSEEAGIKEAAKKLGLQIKAYIKSSPYTYSKISIIGYSLGGIVARAAIEHLQQFKSKLHILLTLSSPHLGLEASENQLVRAGIWYMIKFQKAALIEDMRGRNGNSCEKSYMKLLSEKKNLSWFNKMIVVCCKEDQFVPYCSSSLMESSKDSETGELLVNICQNAKLIEKVDVWFDIEGQTGTLDKWTGRKSHIQFLDNDKFLNRFFYAYAKQF